MEVLLFDHGVAEHATTLVYVGKWKQLSVVMWKSVLKSLTGLPETICLG